MRKATLCGCLLTLQVIAATPGFAQDESLRVNRPAAPSAHDESLRVDRPAPDEASAGGALSNDSAKSNDSQSSSAEQSSGAVAPGKRTLNGSAILNAANGFQTGSDDWISQTNRFGSQLSTWQNKKAMGPTMSVSDLEKLRKQARNRRPTITVKSAHCPATSDPAFQNPPNWLDNLSQEESMRQFGSQWKLWLTAVQNVFQARAGELSSTPGVASVHLIIRPDGSIQEISNYTGHERGNAGTPVSERTLRNLQRLVVSIGKFPPFPSGSRVGRYHLILDASVAR
jgi:hypothetical protein